MNDFNEKVNIVIKKIYDDHDLVLNLIEEVDSSDKEKNIYADHSKNLFKMILSIENSIRFFLDLHNELLNYNGDHRVRVSINNNLFAIAILTRSMLEIHVKIHYLSFILKKNSQDITFPKFDQMCNKLENIETGRGEKFNGAFTQFLKKGRKFYETYSDFTHGNNDILKNVSPENRSYFFSLSDQSVHEALEMIRGLFITSALCYFHDINMQEEAKCCFDRIMQEYPTER